MCCDFDANILKSHTDYLTVRSLSEEEKIEMLEDEESVVSTYSYPGIMNAERMQVRSSVRRHCTAPALSCVSITYALCSGM